MTGEILDSYLTAFNSKMKAERRCILCFLIMSAVSLRICKTSIALFFAS